MEAAIQNFITNPAYADYLSLLKGARNGLVYGAKVRFPHALVIAIIFGHGDWKTRLMTIFRQTKVHAMNLMKYVTLYKVLILAQKKLNNNQQQPWDTFFAGLIGAYVVFGERNPVNEQITLYICSRVVASFIPRAPASPSAVGKPIPPDSRYFSIFAAVVWGAGMWLYDNRGETLQPGLFHSMTYLYRDSNSWNNLRTLIWHNR